MLLVIAISIQISHLHHNATFQETKICDIISNGSSMKRSYQHLNFFNKNDLNVIFHARE